MFKDMKSSYLYDIYQTNKQKFSISTDVVVEIKKCNVKAMVLENIDLLINDFGATSTDPNFRIEKCYDAGCEGYRGI